MYQGLLAYKGDSIEEYDKKTILSFLEILNRLKTDDTEMTTNKGEYTVDREIDLINKLLQGESIRKKAEKRRGDTKGIDIQLDEYRHALLELWVELKSFSRDHELYNNATNFKKTTRSTSRRRTFASKIDSDGANTKKYQRRHTDRSVDSTALKGSEQLVNSREFGAGIRGKLEDFNHEATVDCREIEQSLVAAIQFFNSEGKGAVGLKYKKLLADYRGFDRTGPSFTGKLSSFYRKLLEGLLSDIEPDNSLEDQLKELLKTIDLLPVGHLPGKIDPFFERLLRKTEKDLNTTLYSDRLSPMFKAKQRLKPPIRSGDLDKYTNPLEEILDHYDEHNQRNPSNDSFLGLLSQLLDKVNSLKSSLEDKSCEEATEKPHSSSSSRSAVSRGKPLLAPRSPSPAWKNRKEKELTGESLDETAKLKTIAQLVRGFFSDLEKSQQSDIVQLLSGLYANLFPRAKEDYRTWTDEEKPTKGKDIKNSKRLENYDNIIEKYSALHTTSPRFTLKTLDLFVCALPGLLKDYNSIHNTKQSRSAKSDVDALVELYEFLDNLKEELEGETSVDVEGKLTEFLRAVETSPVSSLTQELNPLLIDLLKQAGGDMKKLKKGNILSGNDSSYSEGKIKEYSQMAKEFHGKTAKPLTTETMNEYIGPLEVLLADYENLHTEGPHEQVISTLKDLQRRAEPVRFPAGFLVALQNSPAEVPINQVFSKLLEKAKSDIRDIQPNSRAEKRIDAQKVAFDQLGSRTLDRKNIDCYTTPLKNLLREYDDLICNKAKRGNNPEDLLKTRNLVKQLAKGLNGLRKKFNGEQSGDQPIPLSRQIRDFIERIPKIPSKELPELLSKLESKLIDSLLEDLDDLKLNKIILNKSHASIGKSLGTLAIDEKNSPNSLENCFPVLTDIEDALVLLHNELEQNGLDTVESLHSLEQLNELKDIVSDLMKNTYDLLKELPTGIRSFLENPLSNQELFPALNPLFHSISEAIQEVLEHSRPFLQDKLIELPKHLENYAVTPPKREFDDAELQRLYTLPLQDFIVTLSQLLNTKKLTEPSKEIYREAISSLQNLNRNLGKTKGRSTLPILTLLDTISEHVQSSTLPKLGKFYEQLMDLTAEDTSTLSSEHPTKYLSRKPSFSPNTPLTRDSLLQYISPLSDIEEDYAILSSPYRQEADVPAKASELANSLKSKKKVLPRVQESSPKPPRHKPPLRSPTEKRKTRRPSDSTLSRTIQEFLLSMDYLSTSNIFESVYSLFSSLCSQSLIDLSQLSRLGKVDPSSVDKLLTFYSNKYQKYQRIRDTDDSLTLSSFASFIQVNKQMLTDYQFLKNSIETTEKNTFQQDEDISELEKLLAKLTNLNDTLNEEENEDFEDLHAYPGLIFQFFNELETQQVDPQDLTDIGNLLNKLKKDLDVISEYLEQGKDNRNYKSEVLTDLADGHEYLMRLRQKTGQNISRFPARIEKYRYHAELLTYDGIPPEDNIIRPLPFSYEILIKLLNFMIKANDCLRKQNREQGVDDFGKINKAVAMYRGLIASMKTNASKGNTTNPLYKAYSYHKKMLSRMQRDLQSIETKLKDNNTRDFDNANATCCRLILKLDGIEEKLDINSLQEVEDLQMVLRRINEEHEKLEALFSRKDTGIKDTNIFTNETYIERLKVTGKNLRTLMDDTGENYDYWTVYYPELLSGYEVLKEERGLLNCSTLDIEEKLQFCHKTDLIPRKNPEDIYMILLKSFIEMISWYEELRKARSMRDLDTYNIHRSLARTKKLLDKLRKRHYELRKTKKSGESDRVTLIGHILNELEFIQKEKHRVRENTADIENYMNYYKQVLDEGNSRRSSSVKLKTPLSSPLKGAAIKYTAEEFIPIYQFLTENKKEISKYTDIAQLIEKYSELTSLESTQILPGVHEELLSIVCALNQHPSQKSSQLSLALGGMSNKFSLSQIQTYLHNLHAVFAFYSKHSHDPLKMSLEQFLSMGRDFSIFDIKKSQSKKTINPEAAKGIFLTHCTDPTLLSEERFISCIEALSEMYFDFEYDMIHRTNVENLPLKQKFYRFLDLLGLQDPALFRPKLLSAVDPAQSSMKLSDLRKVSPRTITKGDSVVKLKRHAASPEDFRRSPHFAEEPLYTMRSRSPEPSSALGRRGSYKRQQGSRNEYLARADRIIESKLSRSPRKFQF